MGAKPVEHGPEAGAAVPMKWTSKALGDLARLHAFLHDQSPKAAAAVVQALTQGAGGLRDNPQIGLRLSEFDPHEVRRVIVGRYELRYERVDDDVYILRLWHTREDR